MTVDPGDSVCFQALNAGWRWAGQDDELFGPRDPERDGGHALAGPIAVRGARAGQTLVGTDRRGASSAPWGVTFAGQSGDAVPLDARPRPPAPAPTSAA